MSTQNRSLWIATAMSAALVVPSTRAAAYEQPGYEVIEKGQ